MLQIVFIPSWFWGRKVLISVFYSTEFSPGGARFSTHDSHKKPVIKWGLKADFEPNSCTVLYLLQKERRTLPPRGMPRRRQDTQEKDKTQELQRRSVHTNKVCSNQVNSLFLFLMNYADFILHSLPKYFPLVFPSLHRTVECWLTFSRLQCHKQGIGQPDCFQILKSTESIEK